MKARSFSGSEAIGLIDRTIYFIYGMPFAVVAFQADAVYKTYFICKITLAEAFSRLADFVGHDIGKRTRDYQQFFRGDLFRLATPP
jgi:hypothetical protein